jgi:tetratricopeptide (TPR) repeat protein
MPTLSVEEIRRCFSSSTDFNEIFDVFQSALAQKLKDVEPYRVLFWNPSLTPDEVRLFGEKLASEFPETAYDVFLWLASIFELTYSSSDNFELAVHYYRRAAQARPEEVDPYLDACDCYDPDLNIPPLSVLTEFLNGGLERVRTPAALYRRLAYFSELSGNPEAAEEFRRKAGDVNPEQPE